MQRVAQPEDASKFGYIFASVPTKMKLNKHAQVPKQSSSPTTVATYVHDKKTWGRKHIHTLAHT